MKSPFDRAQQEFGGLLWVNNDPMAQSTIQDLLSAAEFEVDLYQEGESEATSAEIRKIQRFIKKWK